MEPLLRIPPRHLHSRLPPPHPLHLLHHSRPRCSTPLPILRRRRDRGVSLLARAEPPFAEAASGESSGEESPTAVSPSPKKPDGKGTGFGGSVSAEPKKKKGKSRERGAVVRRSPINKSSLVYSASKENQPPQKQEQQLAVNESAFLLTWLGLGAIILVEGIALAASGFLPEEWDGFFVKYLYPSFTPTVLLFLSGTVAYGVFKYLQAEKMKN